MENDFIQSDDAAFSGETAGQIGGALLGGIALGSIALDAAAPGTGALIRSALEIAEAVKLGEEIGGPVADAAARGVSELGDHIAAADPFAFDDPASTAIWDASLGDDVGLSDPGE